MTEYEFIPDMVGTEHHAWLDIFKEMEEVFECSSEHLNKPKFRRVFVLIEKWAYHDRMRRAELDNPEEHKGILWDGN